MNLAVDIGNSSVKAALFEEGRILQHYQFADPQELFDLISGTERIQKAIWISVRKPNPSWEVRLSKTISSVISFHRNLKLPFSNQYGTPATLGQDRIAALAGAVGLFPNKHVLVIDFGTCITYDYLNAVGEFTGGSISLGITMRYKALHNFTGRLPLLSPAEHDVDMTGKTTEACIHSGVIRGSLMEADAIINYYRGHYPELEVVATGGDHAIFARALKNPIFADPLLVLKGLDAILTLNDG